MLETEEIDFDFSEYLLKQPSKLKTYRSETTFKGKKKVSIGEKGRPIFSPCKNDIMIIRILPKSKVSSINNTPRTTFKDMS